MSEVSGDITLDSIRDHMSATLRSEGGDGVAATSTEVVGQLFTCVISLFFFFKVTVTERELGGGRRETVETVSFIFKFFPLSCSFLNSIFMT